MVKEGESINASKQRGGPLEGLKVLDLGVAGAGPFGATLLAEWGAEVIKVESPEVENLLRRMLPLYNGKSLWFVLEGRNKKYLTLDLRTEKGQKIAKQLAKMCDVVIENYRPGTLESWGLPYEELKKGKDDIILIRISGFGQKGPYRRRTSYDTVGTAISGLLNLTGFPDQPPTLAGLGIADYLGGAFSVLSTLIGLYYRNRKGKGQWVDITQYEVIFRMSEWTASAYHKLGLARQKIGNRHFSYAPEDLYITKDDKWVVISVRNDSSFINLCKAMDREEILDDPRFKSIAQRANHSQAINEIVAQWVIGLNLEEVVEIMVRHQVPVNAVNSVREIFHDPHVQARSNILEMEDPIMGKIKVPNVIPRFSATPGLVRDTGSQVGAHTHEILKNLLGCTEEEIMGLRDEGVIAAINSPKLKREEKSLAQGIMLDKPNGEMALEGLKILELGYSLAGNFGTALLADFGAEVIKIEEPMGEDPLRYTPPFSEGVSLWWSVEGRNKKSVTLNLKIDKGQELFKELVTTSHVVVESFSPGTLERWDLGYERLKEVNERVILLRITGFGQDGPYRNRPSNDAIALAMGGYTRLHGLPEHLPVRPGLAIAEYLAGVFGAMAIMAALYHRDGTGQGQWIDLALYDPLIRFSGAFIPVYHKLGIVRERLGIRFPDVGAPNGLFETKDKKWVAILVVENKEFINLCKALKREDLVDDPRFTSLSHRSKNSSFLNDMVVQWTSQHTVEEMEKIFLENNIPFAPLYTIEDIFRDPQYLANESIIEMEAPLLGKIKMPGIIPRFSLTPGKIKNSGPSLGQHNEEVFTRLQGYEKEKFASLKAEGVI